MHHAPCMLRMSIWTMDKTGAALSVPSEGDACSTSIQQYKYTHTKEKTHEPTQATTNH
jgi:hypothetical protein